MKTGEPSSSTRLLLRELRSNDIIQDLASSLTKQFAERLIWVSPHRGKLRQRTSTGAYQLDSEGGNLADVLHTLFNKDLPEGSEVLEWMSRIIPSIDKVLTPPFEERIDVGIKEKDYPSTTFFIWENLSSGLKNLLILLCTVATSPKESILLIEEPEIHLHPGSQRKLFEYLREKSQDRQIWITTHSSTFASQASLEEVRLVTKDGEGTKVNEIDKKSVGEVLDELEIRASDFFEADFLILTEGNSDAKIFQAFYDTLVKGEEVKQMKIQFLGCGGWGNIEYYANAGILKTRKIPVSVFAVFDGDISNKDPETIERVIEELELDNGYIIKLKKNSIEDYLLVPRAINQAFPRLGLTVSGINKFFQERKTKKNKKTVLKALFRSNRLKYHETDGEKIAKEMIVEEIDSEIRNIFLERIGIRKG